MATSNLKRFGVPAALIVGGVTAGSFFAPIGLAAAQDADTDSEPDTTVETDTVESEDGEQDARPGRGRGHRGAKAEALSEALGLSIDEIRAGFEAGNSVADLAAEQGVSVDDVKAALVASANERLDEAVENERLTEAEADEKRAEIDERLDTFINADPSEFEGRRGGQGHGRRGFGSEVIQETLGMTSEEIRSALRDGQTLSDLAVEQGVTADDLAAAMIAEAEERIDAAVADGRIEADDAAEKKAELEERIDDALNGELPERGEGRRGRGFGRGEGPRGERGGPVDSSVEETSLSA